MAAVEESDGAAAAELQGEALGGDTIGGLHGRYEGDGRPSLGRDEAAEDGRAEAVAEGGRKMRMRSKPRENRKGGEEEYDEDDRPPPTQST